MRTVDEGARLTQVVRYWSSRGAAGREIYQNDNIRVKVAYLLACALPWLILQIIVRRERSAADAGRKGLPGYSRNGS